MLKPSPKLYELIAVNSDLKGLVQRMSVLLPPNVPVDHSESSSVRTRSGADYAGAVASNR